MTLLAGCGGSAAPSSAPAPSSAAPKPSASAPAAASAKPSAAAVASAKPSAGSAGASATGKLEPLKTAYGGAVILQIPLWTAIDQGFLKKYGFDPAPPILASGRTALEQLIAGKVD